MLNMAKRSRTTVEALELKGYRYASSNMDVLKIKLSSLAIGRNDLIFAAVSIVWAALCFALPALAGVLRQVRDMPAPGGRTGRSNGNQ